MYGSYHHSLAPKSISKHSVYSTTIYDNRRQSLRVVESNGARLLQAHKPWNWRSQRKSRTRKELVTSSAAKPWTHQLVSSILRSLPKIILQFSTYNVLKASGKKCIHRTTTRSWEMAAADVVVYADLHSSVPGLEKVKTAMMLRRRFLGKLPKPSLIDNISGLPDELLVRILSLVPTFTACTYGFYQQESAIT
ncbi:hypothetical protein HID58_056413 [Brassica napus]|uniref:F-box domain-containing protein n=1 Tax=Brassica napus TaxID=3708 RepID=A0ABQ8AN47_BRANA|nr:hypothetical protein HID58_056413 [Brassica napus]